MPRPNSELCFSYYYSIIICSFFFVSVFLFVPRKSKVALFLQNLYIMTLARDPKNVFIDLGCSPGSRLSLEALEAMAGGSGWRLWLEPLAGGSGWRL